MRGPDNTPMDELDLIAESRRLCQELKRQLPDIHVPSLSASFVTASGASVTAKLPTKVAAVAGALAWRAHDFAALSCDLFEQQRVIPGAVITRSLMETTALVYLVYKKAAQATREHRTDTLDDFLVRCMSGNRFRAGDPESPNVLTAIQALDKEPGCDRYSDFYSLLCEFAHPNSLGSFYAYSSFDEVSRAVFFGHNRGMTKGSDVAFGLVFALEVLLEFLHKIREMSPRIVELQKELYPHDEAD